MSSFGRFIKLQEDFGFYCTCPACVDSPHYSDLNVKNMLLSKIVSEFNLHLNDNPKQLRLNYDYLMELLRDNFAEFPSIELAMLQMYAFITLEHTSRPIHTFC